MCISRNKTLTLIVLVGMVILFMATVVNAGVTDSDIIRKTTTYYHTTIKVNGTLKNVKTSNIQNFTKTSEEINGNYTDEAVVNIINSLKEEYNNWAFGNGAAIISIEKEGVTDYYYDVHDEITQEGVNSENNIGDVYENQGKIIINTILDKHQTYTVNVTSNDEININLQAPIAGESVSAKQIAGSDVILVGDIDSLLYVEQDNVPVATTSDKITIDSTAWVKGTYPEYGEGFDDYFFGTFEKDKYYYAMISISANDGCLLSSDLNIKVNGEAPAEVFVVYGNNNTHFIAKIKATDYRLGDVNQDGKVNAQDATLILKYLAKKATLTDEQKALADTDRDGYVKASDAVRILKYVTKKINEI